MVHVDGGMKQRRRSIIMYVVGIAIAVLVAGVSLNFFIVNQLRENLLGQFAEQEELIAAQVAQKMQDNVASVRDKLNLVATFPEVQVGTGEACNQKLQQLFIIMESQVNNLGRVGPDGVFKCSLNKALIGVPGAKLGPYITTIFDDPKHEPVLSRAITVPGVKGRIAAVHVPVYDTKKQFVGTVGGAIYFNLLEEKYLRDITFARNGFVALLDDNGDVLYHPQDGMIGKNINSEELKGFYSTNMREALMSAAKTGKSGQVRYMGGGVDRLAAYDPVDVLPGHRWIVAVTVPVNDAEAALTTVGLDRGFMAISLVFTLGVFIIAGAMLYTRLKSLEVDQAKDEFLGLATHQLQTPLTGTKMVLSTLLAGASGKLNAEQREFLNEAYEACQRENRIVQDLLNVARADSGRMKLQKAPTDLAAMLRDIAREQSATIKGRGQTLEVKLGAATVPADGSRLRMAIENLLSNASKYTPKGGQLVLELTTVPGSAMVTVRDNGVGIAAKDVDKLFKKFGRVPNELSEQVGGTGLGLYLVKRIVDLHGGEIDVVSSPGKGSAFTVKLSAK